MLLNNAAVFKDLCILVVDSNLDSRDLLMLTFEQQGAAVVTATCVTEAIELIEHLNPQVLLSEIVLPKEDGYTLMEKVHALTEQKNNPILAIATTSYARPEDRNRTFQAGFQAHLAKPIDLAQVVSVVLDLTIQHPSVAKSCSQSIN